MSTQISWAMQRELQRGLKTNMKHEVSTNLIHMGRRKSYKALLIFNNFKAPHKNLWVSQVNFIPLISESCRTILPDCIISKYKDFT